MNMEFLGASCGYHRSNKVKIPSSMRANRYHFLTPLQNMLISTFPSLLGSDSGEEMPKNAVITMQTLPIYAMRTPAIQPS
jgi:hypothetical protein